MTRAYSTQSATSVDSLRMSVTVADDAVVWEVVGAANASEFLDEYFRLPQTAFGTVEDLRDRSAAAGLTFDDRRQR